MENRDPAQAAAQTHLPRLAATQAEQAAPCHRALETGPGPGRAAADPRPRAMGQERAAARAALVQAVLDDLMARLPGLIAAERAAQAAGPAAPPRCPTAQPTCNQTEQALAAAQATLARLLQAGDDGSPWARHTSRPEAQAGGGDNLARGMVPARAVEGAHLPI